MLARNGNETKIAWSFWGAFGFFAILVGLNADVIQNIDNIVFNSLVRIDNPSLTAMFKIVALLASPGSLSINYCYFQWLVVSESSAHLGIISSHYITWWRYASIRIQISCSSRTTSTTTSDG